MQARNVKPETQNLKPGTWNQKHKMPEYLENSRILLGVSGGISAYKSAELCRRFTKAGARVRAIMTRAATEFVAPLTFETLTGRPVYVDMFDKRRAWEIEHVAWAKWGNVLVIAPGTANVIAKIAVGIADDPLTTTALAFQGPTVVAPAMNAAMWRHPRTRECRQQHGRHRRNCAHEGHEDGAEDDPGDGQALPLPRPPAAPHR